MVGTSNLRADDVFSKRGLEQRLLEVGYSAEIPDVAVLAREGDAAARTVFECFGRDIGLFLVRYSKPFRAEAVLVLGGITGAIDLFGDALKDAVKIPVLAAERGTEAALLGAAKPLFDLQS
jgi:glucokinase